MNGSFSRGEYVTDGIEVIKATSKLVDAQGLLDRRQWRKIVLTTDPDLIAERVKSADDEFLDWFVKNPSCESAEVETKITKDGVWTDLKGYVELPTIHSTSYKIIIPKEETKTYICKDCNKGLDVCTCLEDTVDFQQNLSVRLENSLKQFDLTLREAIDTEPAKLKNIGFGNRSIIELKNLRSKQESIEEREWLPIFKEYTKDNESNLFTFFNWLETNYNPPIKK
jgi:hypothetical protein